MFRAMEDRAPLRRARCLLAALLLGVTACSATCAEALDRRSGQPTAAPRSHDRAVSETTWQMTAKCGGSRVGGGGECGVWCCGTAAEPLAGGGCVLALLFRTRLMVRFEIASRDVDGPGRARRAGQCASTVDAGRCAGAHAVGMRWHGACYTRRRRDRVSRCAILFDGRRRAVGVRRDIAGGGAGAGVRVPGLLRGSSAQGLTTSQELTTTGRWLAGDDVLSVRRCVGAAHGTWSSDPRMIVCWRARGARTACDRAPLASEALDRIGRGGWQSSLPRAGS